MLQLLAPCQGARRILLTVAAPKETQAVLLGLGRPEQDPTTHGAWGITPVSKRFDLVETGIGKANAAAGVASTFDPRRHAGVVSLGVAGSLGGDRGPPIGAVVLASACVYADEGIETPSGFIECAAVGFPLGPFPSAAVPVDAGWLDCLRPLADVVGPIATVSTCSGTDARAHATAERTQAVAEGMEGAAVAQVAARLGIPCAEIRVISNTTGNRGDQVWDLPRALRRLAEVVNKL